MSIRFTCPNCASRIRADDELNAVEIACPHCTSQLYVPDPTVRSARPGSIPVAEEVRMKFHTPRHMSDAEMDMTPMVDVTFLLLIFFMVTAAFSMQKSFQVPTPKEERPSTQLVTLADYEENPEYVVVRIDENSTFHISAAHWNEEREAPSAQDLIVGLAEARAGAGDRAIPSRLLVVAHGNAFHQQVVAAMDAGTEVGMQDIKLVTVEEDRS